VASAGFLAGVLTAPALCADDGKTPGRPNVLGNEPREFSCPAAIETDDGKFRLTLFQRRGQIKYVAVDSLDVSM
jgi:hypothetical protein